MATIKGSHSFRKFLTLATGFISGLSLSSSYLAAASEVAVAQQLSPNLLRNASFEQGLQYWDGPARATGLHSCESGQAQGGKCYAWFEDPSGESIFQDIQGDFSGKYRASVFVKGGPGTLVVWRWCRGRDAAADHVDFGASPGWKRVTVVTNPQGCEKLKFEVYLKGSRNSVDNAGLYSTF
ncbi:hypothetical protein [Leptolyngbya sp. FACHB-17]|uniref:hypothetical protein n=1 Tax=Leptolyngbya sp. FACHB-17 TaxID=2692803 RepID=UPI00168024E4|nr:hypothetical protein [Leptolyngbya sp. FACHB-17]MBD2078672.1 hypothetical protein [Leptolyngbya sp. FACHB-17]